MEIRIKDAIFTEVLTLIDPKTGCDYISDFIGNQDGFGEGDHQFNYNDDCGEYTCDQATFEWWSNAVRQQNEIDELVFSMNLTEAEHQGLIDAGDNDLDMCLIGQLDYLTELKASKDVQT